MWFSPQLICAEALPWKPSGIEPCRAGLKPTMPRAPVVGSTRLGSQEDI